jgi:hypothetical protein
MFNSGGGESHRVPAEAQVETIERAHQRHPAIGVRLIEEARLHRCRRMKVEQHDTGFLIAICVAARAFPPMSARSKLRFGIPPGATEAEISQALLSATICRAIAADSSSSTTGVRSTSR